MLYTKDTIDEWLKDEAQRQLVQGRWPRPAVVGFYGEEAGLFASCPPPTAAEQLGPVGNLLTLVSMFHVDGYLVSIAANARTADETGSVEAATPEPVLIVETAFGPLGSRIRHEVRLLGYEQHDDEIVWKAPVVTVPDPQQRSTWWRPLRTALRRRPPRLGDLSHAELAEGAERLGYVLDVTPKVAERFDLHDHALPAGV